MFQRCRSIISVSCCSIAINSILFDVITVITDITDTHREGGDLDTHREGGDLDTHREGGDLDTHREGGDLDKHREGGDLDTYREGGYTDPGGATSWDLLFRASAQWFYRPGFKSRLIKVIHYLIEIRSQLFPCQ